MVVGKVQETIRGLAYWMVSSVDDRIVGVQRVYGVCRQRRGEEGVG